MKALTIVEQVYRQQISIQKVPSKHGLFCELTINIPWEIAEKVAATAAPFLAAISTSVDLRTRHEATIAARNHDTSMRFKEKARQERLRYMRALKLVYQGKLSDYGDFCDIVGDDVLDFTPKKRRHWLFFEARRRRDKKTK